MGWGRWALAIAAGCAAALLGSHSWSLPVLANFERAVFDAYSYFNADIVGDDERITLILFDEAVIRDTGKSSPLDRAVLAEALRNIDRFEPRSIGIDLVFLQPTEDEDLLIAALSSLRTPTFLAYADPDYDNVSYWDPSIGPEAERYQDAFWSRISSPTVRPASPAIGGDPDGIARRWPGLTGKERPPLAAAMADAPGYGDYRGAIAWARLSPEMQEEGLEEASGMFASLPVTALSDPLLAAAMGPFVRGRHVLIGADSFNSDQLSTPVTRLNGAPTIAGVFAHAHMLRQALDEPPRPAIGYWAGLALCLGFAALAFATARIERRILLLVLAIAFQAAASLALPLAAHRAGYDILGMPIVGTLAAWLLAYLAASYAARSAGSEAREFAQGALGKFLPETVARQIIDKPETLNLAGERRAIYIMFTDLQGFTKFSHSLEPEASAAILNDYLARMSDIVLDHGGTIDKYVGDAIVAFWGAPYSSEDDARKAVECMLAIDREAEIFREELAARNHELGRTRIGLHHGEALVGNFGGDKRIQYTALGDAINTAARLESANKVLGSRMLASAPVADAYGRDSFRPLGMILLSGVGTPIEVYEPLTGNTADHAADMRRAYQAAVEGVDGGVEKLEQLKALHPEDEALARMAERMAKLEPGQAYALQSK